jgi:hypothetical protein
MGIRNNFHFISTSSTVVTDRLRSTATTRQQQQLPHCQVPVTTTTTTEQRQDDGIIFDNSGRTTRTAKAATAAAALLHLDDSNVEKYANLLFDHHHHHQSNSTTTTSTSTTTTSRPLEALSIHISALTAQTTKAATLVLQFVQTAPHLHDVRLCSGNNYSTAPPCRTSRTTTTTTASCSSTAQQTMAVKRFLNAVCANPSIEHLTLDGVTVDATSIVNLLVAPRYHSKKNPRLSDLSLSECTLVPSSAGDADGHLKRIAAAFRANRSLESVALAGLDDPVLLHILHGLKSHTALRRLDVSYVSARSAAAIATLIHPQSHVTSSDSSISSSSSSNNRKPPLEYLVLRDSSLLAFEPIVRSLQQQHQFQNNPCSAVVKSLEITNCDIDAVSASLLRSLARSSGTIQSYSFCYVDFDRPDNLDDILQGLQWSTAVQRIKLHHMNVQPPVQALLSLVHTSNKNLHRVELDRKLLSLLNGSSSSCSSNNTIRMTQQGATSSVAESAAAAEDNKIIASPKRGGITKRFNFNTL